MGNKHLLLLLLDNFKIEMRFSIGNKCVFANMLLLCVLFAVLPFCLAAQGNSSQFSEYKEVWFDSITGKINSGIINGRRNWDYYYNSIGHQYFKEASWLKGDITYRGEHYSNIFMKYDVNKDIILVRHRSKKPREILLELHADEISQFNILGHHFQRLKFPDEVQHNLKPGFYDIMFTGDQLSLISKRYKTKEDNLEGGIVRQEFESKDKFYLEFNHQYYKVKRAKHFFKLFKPNKKEIKNFLKENHIRRRETAERALIMITSFCNELPNLQL